MTAKELIALFEKAVVLLEEHNEKLDKESRDYYKRRRQVSNDKRRSKEHHER
jgi:hypothetical protein